MTFSRPLSYMGIKESNPPQVIIADRAPTAADIHHDLMDEWLNATSNIVYKLVDKTAGVATWGVMSPGASDVDTINGLAPALGNIVIAGGTNMTDVNAGNTVTLNLDDAINLATSVTSPLFTAGVGNDVVIQMGDAAGANKVSFVDSAAVEQFAIDSNGGIGALGGLTVTGALTQTAGAVNIAQDNAADAVNIAGGNVARAITFGATGAHTLDIGSAAAGAIAVDSAAGVSIDGATASNFTVTGASQDLTLVSVGGSVGIAASESAADAIVINASGAAGGVQVQAGTGGVLIGNQADCTTLALGDFAPTADRTITIGGGTVITASVDDVIDIGVDGATTNADSTKTVNINTGGVTLGVLATNIMTGAVTSGTHTTSIATGNRAAGTMATNVMTGTGTKTFNLGNADALTTCNVDAITLINDSVNAATSINTGTSTGAVTIGNGLSGAIGVVGGAAVTVDAVGVLELNSSGAAIGIGNDADAFNINVGTGAAARTITIGNGTGATSVVLNSGTGAASFGTNATVHTTTVGSTTGASATVIQSGTGDITVTGTVKEIDAEFLYASGDDIVFQSDPMCQIASGTYAVPAGVTGEVDNLFFQEGVMMQQFIIGAGQTILAPTMDANGLLASLDLTATEGVEYNFGAARTNSRHAFTIGTSPAFFFELRFRINDMDGADPYIFGFRKSAANNATWESYTDYAAIGMNAATSVTQVVIADELNSGGTTLTNTTDLWGGDGTTNTLKVLVSAAGVVTYTINGAAPSVTHALTFDNGDVVVPFIRIEHSASPTAVNLVSMKIGYQA